MGIGSWEGSQEHFSSSEIPGFFVLSRGLYSEYSDVTQNQDKK